MSIINVVILGAGFGGLEASLQLKTLLGEKCTITLVDKKKTFYMGLAKLWVITGKRSEQECYINISKIKQKGIQFVNANIQTISPKKKIVETTAGIFSYDFLIIALGADLSSEVTGFEYAYNLYNLSQAENIHRALQTISSGVISIVVTKTPFKCPGAPYEAAFLIADYLTKEKKRGKITLQIITPEPQPLPVAGKAAGDKIRLLLEKQGIRYFPTSKLKEIKRGEIVTDEKTFTSDLTLLIPPHVVPSVVRQAGLTTTEWIDVDRDTLQTSFPNIYAIGDVALIKLGNGMVLPKIGILAEEEAKVVANTIASTVTTMPAKKFTGRGYCFIETGKEEALKVDAHFFATPAPQVYLESPSREFYKKKIQFEKERISRWFNLE